MQLSQSLVKRIKFNFAAVLGRERQDERRRLVQPAAGADHRRSQQEHQRRRRVVLCAAVQKEKHPLKTWRGLEGNSGYYFSIINCDVLNLLQ